MEVDKEESWRGAKGTSCCWDWDVWRDEGGGGSEDSLKETRDWGRDLEAVPVREALRDVPRMLDLGDGQMFREGGSLFLVGFYVRGV